MEFLQDFLPILIYLLLAVLIAVLIVLGLKLIETINKTNAILDDVEKKSQSLNGVFEAIDNVTDAVSLVSNHLVDGLSGFVGKILNIGKKKKREKKVKEEEKNNE